MDMAYAWQTGVAIRLIRLSEQLPDHGYDG